MMNPISQLYQFLKNKYGKGRTPTASEVLASVYDPETNSLRIS